jgi:hypothetical protein
MSRVDWRRKSEGLIVGKEQLRRENVEEIRGARTQEERSHCRKVDDDISPKGTVTARAQVCSIDGAPQK